jgi:uncharacterized repeat protein (TIGR02543 family)
VKTGYRFTGWNTAPDGLGDQYSETATIDISITGSLYLYAQWEIAYTVTYDGNGNTGGTAPIDSLQYPSSYTVSATVKAQGDLVKEGYTFAGWNTDALGEGVHYDADDTISMTANVNLYAEWEPTECSVTYDANGATSGTAPTDGGSPYSPSTSVTVLGQNDLLRTGYTFAGWNTAANGSGTPYTEDDTFTIAINTTLYAQWTQDMYTITFDANGATGTGPSPVTDKIYGATITVPSYGTLEKTGHTFNGWNTAEDGSGMSYAPGSDLTVTGNTTLYAQWKANQYVVTYYEGDYGSFTSVSSPAYETVTYSECPVLVPEVAADEGYKFLGWIESVVYGYSKTAKPGYITTAQLESLSITGSVSYTAYYEVLDECTVTFDSDGGTAVASQTVYEGEKLTEPNEPIKEGYIFNGWYSDVETVNLWDFDTDTVTSSIKLYADWIVDNSGDGGSVTPDNPDVQKGNITLILKDSNGNPLAYYPVELHSTVIKATTDANGQVTFTDVTLENHELVVFDKEGNELGTIYLNMTESDTNSTNVNGNDVAISFNESAVSIDIEIFVGEGGSLTIQEVIINANPKTSAASELAYYIVTGNIHVNIIPYLSIILSMMLICVVFITGKKESKNNR